MAGDSIISVRVIIESWVYPVEEFRFCPYRGEPLNRLAWGGWYGHSGDCIGGAGGTGQDGD